jgi:hypothetical protein
MGGLSPRLLQSTKDEELIRIAFRFSRADALKKIVREAFKMLGKLQHNAYD